MDATGRSEAERLWTPLVVVAFAVGLAAVVLVALFSVLILNIGTCGGDGGSPYAPPASARGQFCEEGGGSAPLWAPAIALVVGFLFALMHRRRAYLWATLIAALVLAVAPNLVALALSKDCTKQGPTDYDCW
jgi:predicted lysophospholipase L1 biosynthesis ABC-type transport system permease subunit